MSESRMPLLAVYGAALLQGLTLVSFPASSAVLRHLHGFSETQYGAIFCLRLCWQLSALWPVARWPGGYR